MMHEDTHIDTDNLTKIASAQRFMLWSIFFGIIGSVASVAVPVAMIFTIPIMLYAVYRLSSLMHYSGSLIILCMLFVLIPIINLITLFIINSGATRRLRAAGIHIGVMGASASDVQCFAMDAEAQPQVWSGFLHLPDAGKAQG